MQNFSYKQLWLIVYPILISLLMEHMIGLTDTAFLGRVGEVELGASAIAGVYYLVIFMLAFGFGIGSQILIARRNGEGNYKEIGTVFFHGMVFLLALATVMFVVSRTYTPILLKKFISSENVYMAAIDYMNWRVYGFFFSFAAIMFRAMFVGTTNTKTLTLNSVVMVLTNVVLNYVLIFGKLGMPALGIKGAAIASSIAEMVSLVFFVLYTWLRIDWRKYNLFHFTGFRWSLLSHILGISVWTMIQYFVALSTWFIFFVAIEHLGERPLAVTNIIRSISSMLFVVVSAYAQAASSVVSNMMGGGQQKHVTAVLWKIIKMCYATTLILVAVIAVFPHETLRIYTDNTALIDSSLTSLFVMLSMYLIAVPSQVMFNAVSGTGNTRSALAMELCALTVYVLFILYVIVYRKADVAVCWTSEHVYALSVLVASYIYFRKANWQSKKI